MQTQYQPTLGPGFPAMHFDAFLSYSQAADRALAPALQLAIERVGRPWHRSRARRIFRDKATLTPGPSLWGKLETSLEQSRWYVLLCSPESAASYWVAQELSWWLRHRGQERLLLVVTGGDLAVHSASGRVDPERTTCLPTFAAHLLDEEPLWLDLRWASHQPPEEPAALARFTDAAAEIAAAISEVTKDELIGDNIRERRRTRKLITAVVTALSVLVLLASAGGVIAVRQRNAAQSELLKATSQQLVGNAAGIRDTQPGLARQLIVSAYRQAPTTAALGAVLGSSTLPIAAFEPTASDMMAADPQRNLVALGRSGAIELRLIDDASLTATIDAEPVALAYSGDGTLLAAAEKQGIRVWSVASASSPHEIGDQTLLGTNVTSLAFLGGSHRLATLSDKGVITVVDLSRAGESRVLSVRSEGGAAESGQLFASADGRRLATCGDSVNLRGVSSDGRVGPVQPLSIGGCGHIAMSNNGDLVAIASGDLVSLFDVVNPAHPRRLGPLAGSTLGADHIAFSPDNTTLAVGAGDGTIRLWNIADPFRPTIADEIAELGGSTSGLVFSGDSHFLIAETDGQDRSATLRIWPIWSGARSTQLGELSTIGSQVAFGPDSLALAGNVPRLWDLSDRRRPLAGTVLGGYRFGGAGLAISQDRRVGVVGSPPVLYDLSDQIHPQKLIDQPPAPTEPSQLTFLPGDRAVVAVVDSSVIIWDISGPTPVTLSTLGAEVSILVGQVSISPDGTRLALATDHVTIVYDLTDLRAPRPIHHLLTPDATHVCFVNGNDTLAVADASGELSVWQRSDQEFVRSGSARRHAAGIGGIGAHPTQPWVATGGEDGVVRLWDVKDPAHPAELIAYAHGGRYDGARIAFSPDGRTLATSDSTSIRLWDVDLPGILSGLCQHSDTISAAEWETYLPQRPFDPPCR